MNKVVKGEHEPDDSDERVLRLSRRDAEAFVKALADPPEPSARVRAAARRYLESSGKA